jgi:Flp pilus assembly protein TadG
MVSFSRLRHEYEILSPDLPASALYRISLTEGLMEIAPENIVKSKQELSSLLNQRRKSRNRGGSLIEMVFAFQLLLFLTFGMVEFGQYMYIRHAFVSAVRDGARVAILPTTTTQTPIDNAISRTLSMAGVMNYSSSWLTLTQSSDGVNYSACPGPSNVNSGDAISLSLSTTYSALPLALRPLSAITGNHWGIGTAKLVTATATMVRE